MTNGEFKTLYRDYLKGKISLKEVMDQLPVGVDINRSEVQYIVDEVMTEFLENKGW